MHTQDQIIQAIQALTKAAEKSRPFGRLLGIKRSAEYLDMSERAFRDLVMPHLKPRNIGNNRVIYHRHDLDEWSDNLDTITTGDDDLPGENTCKNIQNPQESSRVVAFGTSTKSSKPGTAKKDGFASQLAAARKKSSKRQTS